VRGCETADTFLVAPCALSLGYDTDRFKLIAFILSSTVAGMAGGTKALVFQLASLTDVRWIMSGEVVLMTLVGGLGTLFGPVVGAAVIVTMQNYLSTKANNAPTQAGTGAL